MHQTSGKMKLQYFTGEDIHIPSNFQFIRNVKITSSATKTQINLTELYVWTV